MSIGCPYYLTKLTNGSILSDRFNVVPMILTSVNAMFYDPTLLLLSDHDVHLSPPLNTEPVNF
jgi:hypothetical protein